MKNFQPCFLKKHSLQTLSPCPHVSDALPCDAWTQLPNTFNKICQGSGALQHNKFEIICKANWLRRGVCLSKLSWDLITCFQPLNTIALGTPVYHWKRDGMYSVYMWNHLKIFIPPKKVSKAKQKVQDHFTALTPNKFIIMRASFLLWIVKLIRQQWSPKCRQFV